MIEHRSRVKPRSSSREFDMATSQAAVANGDHAIPADAGQAGYPRRWLAAIVLIVGALMDMIDVTIVNVALPSIRRDLHASATQLEWVVSGYMLAFAATLIIAGNLGDLVGRKRVFLAGRSEEHTSELQSRVDLVCRLLLEKKKIRSSRGSHGH